uniref:Uncharacterized protein n=1 Tax=Chromera velia CCMP2878 TaxID=1169474 RepID=A0A0G4HX65_9ALVE|eukprot:Cvel_9213.t1-p1 / transcript=Cvel_9213.t1 / gene=Cvel_9213 / organism=Chromera_velia_CCMP2878 / gene_product=hypothetical protein / transcript_product=hypothetical protein / location=Cvel_scaffold525:33401-42662(-) / protein_length=976 / sequence_SO=supercontig / SO=protein_coding / is_pseudo=false
MGSVIISPFFICRSLSQFSAALKTHFYELVVQEGLPPPAIETVERLEPQNLQKQCVSSAPLANAQRSCPVVVACHDQLSRKTLMAAGTFKIPPQLLKMKQNNGEEGLSSSATSSSSAGFVEPKAMATSTAFPAPECDRASVMIHLVDRHSRVIACKDRKSRDALLRTRVLYLSGESAKTNAFNGRRTFVLFSPWRASLLPLPLTAGGATEEGGSLSRQKQSSLADQQLAKAFPGAGLIGRKENGERETEEGRPPRDTSLERYILDFDDEDDRKTKTKRKSENDLKDSERGWKGEGTGGDGDLLEDQMKNLQKDLGTQTYGFPPDSLEQEDSDLYYNHAPLWPLWFSLRESEPSDTRKLCLAGVIICHDRRSRDILLAIGGGRERVELPFGMAISPLGMTDQKQQQDPEELRTENDLLNYLRDYLKALEDLVAEREGSREMRDSVPVIRLVRTEPDSPASFSGGRKESIETSASDHFSPAHLNPASDLESEATKGKGEGESLERKLSPQASSALLSSCPLDVNGSPPLIPEGERLPVSRSVDLSCSSPCPPEEKKQALNHTARSTNANGIEEDPSTDVDMRVSDNHSMAASSPGILSPPPLSHPSAQTSVNPLAVPPPRVGTVYDAGGVTAETSKTPSGVSSLDVSAMTSEVGGSTGTPAMQPTDPRQASLPVLPMDAQSHSAPSQAPRGLVHHSTVTGSEVPRIAEEGSDWKPSHSVSLPPQDSHTLPSELPQATGAASPQAKRICLEQQKEVSGAGSLQAGIGIRSVRALAGARTGVGSLCLSVSGSSPAFSAFGSTGAERVAGLYSLESPANTRFSGPPLPASAGFGLGLGQASLSSSSVSVLNTAPPLVSPLPSVLDATLHQGANGGVSTALPSSGGASGGWEVGRLQLQLRLSELETLLGRERETARRLRREAAEAKEARDDLESRVIETEVRLQTSERLSANFQQQLRASQKQVQMQQQQLNQVHRQQGHQ